MKVLLGLTRALSGPLAALNLLCSIVAPIWLLIIGEWRTVVIGILVFLLGYCGLKLAGIPAGLIDVPALLFAAKRRWLAACVLSVPGILYLNAVVTIWCALAFRFVAGSAVASEHARASHFVPAMAWSFGIAMGALSEAVLKESTVPNGVALLSAELGYVFVMLQVCFFGEGSFVSFAWFMAVGTFAQVPLSYRLLRDIEPSAD